jgi:NADH dehydrogenase FAD-containing subunit
MAAQRIPRIVVVGGGFGGLETAFYLKQRLGGGAEIELISDDATFLYKPDTVRIPFGLEPDRLRVEIEGPTRRRGILFMRGRVTDLDTDRQTVRVEGRTIGFDKLVIATGAAFRTDLVPGLPAAAVALGSVPAMLELRERFEQLVQAAGDGEPTRIVFLLPAGARWANALYEMCWMLDTWLTREGARRGVELSFVTHERSFIEAFGPRMDAIAEDEFARRGITALRSFEVAGIDRARIISKTHNLVPYDLLVTFPPAVAATRFPGLPADADGFISTVSATRQVQGHPHIYAVGDAADLPVKQAYLATTQADAAAEHIAAGVLGEPPRFSFEPKAVAIMDRLDGASFAQVPVHGPADDVPADEAAPDATTEDEAIISDSPLWRAGRLAVARLVLHSFRAGLPVHTGAAGAAIEVGRSVLRGTLKGQAGPDV